MQLVQEGNLRFGFPDDWAVVKYDESSFYRDQIERCEGTKAVDIIAYSRGDMFIIEVKDFRGYRIQNKERLTNSDLAIEIAQKVRDTMAGMYRAHTGRHVRNSSPSVLDCS
jgi:hypothetical protein